MRLKSINPYTGALIEEFEEYSDDKLEVILTCSLSAFEKWKRTDFTRRKLLLKKAADILNGNAREYALTITMEMGKPIVESMAEVEKCAWVCNYYAENGENFLTEETVVTDAFSSSVRYEPLGPILGVMPWNFPFWQVFRFAAPTLMAGNSVLLKHSSNVQGCARLIENIFVDAGFPPDLFSNLVIGSSRVRKIIEHEAVKAVSLTGSEFAGHEVGEVAGRNIKKSLLELGGNNAFVVLEDADIENAARVGLRARMMNSGQSCIAAKRFIICEQVSERFIKLFNEKLQLLKTGDPMLEETDIGPLASVEQAETVEWQVKESIGLGARMLTGGIRSGAFYSPSIILDAEPGMPVFDEEVFGPVAPITIARNTAEAVSLANMTRFGLGASIFTNDLEKARNLVSEFNDGAVFINDLVKSDPRLPFGGTGRSGYGRELSIHGIREFVNVKTVYAKKF